MTNIEFTSNNFTFQLKLMERASNNAYYKTSSPPALAATNKVANPAVKRFAHVCASPLSFLLSFIWSIIPQHFPLFAFLEAAGHRILRNTSSTLSPTSHISVPSGHYPLLIHLNLHSYFYPSLWMVLDVTIDIRKVKSHGQLVPTVLTDRWVDRSALYKS